MCGMGANMWLVWIHDWKDRKPIGIFESEQDAKTVADQVHNAGYGRVKAYPAGDTSLRHDERWCARAYAVGDNAAIKLYAPERETSKDSCALVDSDGVVQESRLQPLPQLETGTNDDGPYAIAVASTAAEAERMAREKIEELAAPLRMAWEQRSGVNGAESVPASRPGSG